MAVETTTGGTLITGSSIMTFHLVSWKHAILLEQKGIRFRRSVRKHAATSLGLNPRASVETVIAAIEAAIEANVAGTLDTASK